jgi:hypothetical protein
MFVVGLAFLALFSVISIMLGNEDPRHNTDPRDNPALWLSYRYR